MWIRAIWMAMRSSAGLPMLPVLVGLEVGVVLVEGQSWHSEWKWALDWAGAGVFLSAPMAGGLAAWHAQHPRCPAGEAAQAVGSRSKLLLMEAGGVLVWAIVAHVLTVAWVVAYCWHAGLSGWPNPWVVTLHISFIASCVAVGSIAGRFSPSRLLPPLVAILMLLFVIESSNGSLPVLWVEVAGATAPLSSLEYRPEIVLTQMCAYWAIVVVAQALTTGVGSRVVRWSCLTIGCLVVAAALARLSAERPERFEALSANKVDSTCVGSRPEVCVAYEMTLRAEEIQGIFADIHDIAGSRAKLPLRYVHVAGYAEGSEADRQFELESYWLKDQTAESVLTRYVVWNRACLLADDPPPSRAVDLLADLEMVLLHRLGQLHNESRLMDKFDRLPQHVQDQWIADSLAASNQCDFARIPDWIDRL